MGEKSEQTVYLSGSINGHITARYPTTWRGYAQERLEAVGYTVLDPMRGRKFEVAGLSEEQIEEIIVRDINDIHQSDIVLVEMDCPGMPYIGTAMEIRHAYVWCKEILVWGEANRGSIWLQYHTDRRFGALDDALEYLIALREAE